MLIYLSITGTGRFKRHRTAFTINQLQELEKFFKRTKYPPRPYLIDISKQLKINELQVKIWFQNRRAKEKRVQKTSSRSESASPPLSSQSRVMRPSLPESLSPTPSNESDISFVMLKHEIWKETPDSYLLHFSKGVHYPEGLIAQWQN